MTHAELASVALGLNASLLLGAIAAYYKYGDRTEVLAKSIGGTESIVRRLRQQIVSDLIQRLRKFLGLTSGPDVVSVLLSDPSRYLERAASPIEGEAVKEELRNFIESDSEAIADYTILRQAKNNWLFWARFMSWALLALLVWQLTVTGALAFVDRLGGVSIPDDAIRIAAAISMLGVFACVCPLPFMLKYHDDVSTLRVKYDDV